MAVRCFFSLAKQLSSHITSTLALARISKKPLFSMATRQATMLTPPVCTLTSNGERQLLNHDLFKKTVTLPALQFSKKLTKSCVKALKSRMLPRKQFKTLRENPRNPEENIILLDPAIVISGEIATLGEQGCEFLNENSLEETALVDFQIQLEYSDWTSEEVLRSLLPEGMEVPTSFSRIGHIAHLNLRSEHVKYKHIIGEVIMHKNPGIKTVVNKTGEINNEFRFFEMELLAGEDNMVATTKEHGHSFTFDFSKVYWNPRLSTEHTRIVGLLREGDVIYDVFAGVGPFAIPAAKKRCKVFANDRNEESYRWLNGNVKLNKAKPELVRTYNMDGRDFIRNVIRKDLISRAALGHGVTRAASASSHVVMNLPSLAIEFLDVFPCLLEDTSPEVRSCIVLPTVHCYCFSKEVDAVEDVRRRIESVLNHAVEGAVIHDVRDVAPNKEMLCASFEIPAAVVFRETGSNMTNEDEETRPTKKSRTE